MSFLGVYKALYDYEPQSEEELAIIEGDILYILEKGDEDCWWKAKKKASEVDEEEPVGLVPNNYVEEARPISLARALYDYTRQTDEEMSFTESSQLEVFDTSDTDWILVGLNGEYGFAPANYIEIGDLKDAVPHVSSNCPLNRSVTESGTERSQSLAVSTISPSKALAVVAQDEMGSVSAQKNEHVAENSDDTSQNSAQISDGHQEKSRSRSPPLVEVAKKSPTPDNTRSYNNVDHQNVCYSPQGFHMYNINEMVSLMGRRRKMPTTLGINNATGVILIAPEKSRDGQEQMWTAEKMTHYSIEGKHVFLEMIQPNKSFDFHAGAKDTAQEIVGALGEIAGAIKAEGLREVIMMGSGISYQKGLMLYDFTAQEENEVTVMAGDEVVILEDAKNEEWWRIRRLKDGSEGVVPSIYVEARGVYSVPNKSAPNGGRSIVEQNRLEEERLAKDSIRADKGFRNPEVGPGMQLPERGSSLSRQENSNKHDLQRYKTNRNEKTQSNESKLKPDPDKVRTWSDRSKSFSVEAQFLALKDGKINLHKMNGVKIAVPVAKMSIEDLEYVERQTGISLDDDKPLSGLKKSRSQGFSSSKKPAAHLGASIEKKEYDWFQFFLDCNVSINLCERYSQAFQRDSMDESVLSDIDATVLRTLGIREGDIIKIMRFLDKKFSRSVQNHNAEGSIGPSSDSQGGLFSGPGGTIKNNTRKNRPIPAIQTNNIIDLDAFSSDSKSRVPPEIASTSTASTKDTLISGFEDDAWAIKSTQGSLALTSTSTPQPQPSKTVSGLSGAMEDLSLLATPLEPCKPQPTPSLKNNQTFQQTPKSPQGATPSFFAGILSQQSGLVQHQADSSKVELNSKLNANLNVSGHHQPINHHFQGQHQGSFVFSTPNRPVSAPIVNRNGPFTISSLQPQATGIQTSAGYQQQGLSYNQNLTDPRMQQIVNDSNPSPNQVNLSGIASQHAYNRIGPQPYGIQPNLLQSTGQTGFIQQNYNNNGISPFSDIYSQQFSPNTAQSMVFQSSFPQRFDQPTSMNNFLPVPLHPTSTINQQQSSFNPNFTTSPHQQALQLNTISPLVPQKTGPPPSVRFGVSSCTKKLVPQPTGRRANLSQATPQNPFGF